MNEAICGGESSSSCMLMPLAALAMMAGALSADAAAATTRIVAMGTSLTARGGWSDPLASALSRCMAKEATVTVIARPGATSSWGRLQVERALSVDPDLVLIEFAVNDAAIQNFITLAQSRENIRAILSALRAAPRPPRVFLMAMNPVHGAKAWLRPSLKAYEAAHQELAHEEGAGFIDHRTAWMLLAQGDRDRLIPDGLHPDPREDAKIIVPTLVKSLAGTECRGEAAPPWRH